MGRTKKVICNAVKIRNRPDLQWGTRTCPRKRTNASCGSVRCECSSGQTKLKTIVSPAENSLGRVLGALARVEKVAGQKCAPRLDRVSHTAPLLCVPQQAISGTLFACINNSDPSRMEHQPPPTSPSDGDSAREDGPRDVAIRVEHVAADPATIDLSSFSVRCTSHLNRLKLSAPSRK